MSEAAEIDWEDEARLESELEKMQMAIENTAEAREQRKQDLKATWMRDPMMFREAVMEVLVEDEDKITSLYHAVMAKDGIEAIAILAEAFGEWVEFQAEEQA